MLRHFKDVMGFLPPLPGHAVDVAVIPEVHVMVNLFGLLAGKDTSPNRKLYIRNSFRELQILLDLVEIVLLALPPCGDDAMSKRERAPSCSVRRGLDVLPPEQWAEILLLKPTAGVPLDRDVLGTIVLVEIEPPEHESESQLLG